MFQCNIAFITVLKDDSFCHSLLKNSKYLDFINIRVKKINKKDFLSLCEELNINAVKIKKIYNVEFKISDMGRLDFLHHFNIYYGEE